jgi:hypothetical protein
MEVEQSMKVWNKSKLSVSLVGCRKFNIALKLI